MSGILEQLSSIIFRLALILCVLTDFTATVLLCITFVGIGWAGWYASRLEVIECRNSQMSW